jgi:hypothetical protein
MEKRRAPSLTETRIQRAREENEAKEKQKMSERNSLKKLLSIKKVTPKHFFLINKYAGKMSICKNCEEDLQKKCKNIQCCELLVTTSHAYFQTHQKKNPEYVEKLTIPQLATLDLIFTQKLNYALKHLHDTKEVTGSDGKVYLKELVGIDYLYALINMAKSLNKSMADMQLTSQTKETMDVAWAHLSKAKVDPKKADELKAKILKGVENWEKKKAAAKKREKEDPAIIRYEKEMKDMDKDRDIDIDDMDLPPNPFGDN